MAKGNELDKLIENSLPKLKKVLSNQGTLAGAALGYLLSEDNKERNAIIGGIAGYVLSEQLGKKKTDDDEDES